MRKLGMIAMSLIVLSISGTASASPCDTAQRGTYLSNVCWLVEKFTEGGYETKIASVDQEACTVEVTKPLWNNDNPIYFNRADPKDIRIEWSEYFTCWRLIGEGVHGEGDDEVQLCGKKIEAERVRSAFRNLYTEYCEGNQSEF